MFLHFFFVGGRAGSGYVTVAALAILQPSVGITGTCHLCGVVWLVCTPVVSNTKDFLFKSIYLCAHIIRLVQQVPLSTEPPCWPFFICL